MVFTLRFFQETALRLKLTIAYIGTKFKGWQTQAHAHIPHPRTVQAELEAIISRIAGKPVRVHGSGRTDSGVHADGQVAHVDIPDEKADLNWLMAINANLPPDVAVVDILPVSDNFHAQYSCLHKTYTYSLWLNRTLTPPRLRGFVWSAGPLDLTAMQEAAMHFVGRHDFASMQNTGTILESTIRTIYAITCAVDPEPAWKGQLIRWQIKGDGFLKQMARNMMGLLVETGRGKLPPSAVPGIIASCDRSLAPATAPACGLCLSAVHYTEHQ
jgi:tRNA pseudouridine38-40 synthase